MRARMASFAYSAINAEGMLLEGEVSASSLDGAREQLRLRGLLADRLEELAESSGGSSTAFKKVKPKSLQIFSRQFATMIDAGLPLVQCLDIQAEQQPSKPLQEVLRAVKSEVEQGATFADSLRKHPKTFDDLYVNLVHAGEVPPRQHPVGSLGVCMQQTPRIERRPFADEARSVEESRRCACDIRAAEEALAKDLATADDLSRVWNTDEVDLTIP